MSKNEFPLTKLINTVYRCTQCYLDKRFEKYGLTTGSYPYLMILNRVEGISQNDISRELNVDKAMSARTIKKLIELGYIRKEENSEDTRAYKLYITEKAKNTLPEILEIINEWISILEEGSSEEEIEISTNFLENALENAKRFRMKNCNERGKTNE